jgi:hypothetical protein
VGWRYLRKPALTRLVGGLLIMLVGIGGVSVFW